MRWFDLLAGAIGMSYGSEPGAEPEAEIVGEVVASGWEGLVRVEGWTLSQDMGPET